MAAQQIPFKLPPGRIVWGDLYKPRDKDFEGRPLVYKTGPDAGKPRVTYDFGVAIPKEPGGQHWAHTEWGKAIWQAGHSRINNAGQLPDFAWKVVDGDSTVVKQQPGKPPGKAPKDREGHAGCWIVALSSSFAPQIVNATTGKFEPMPQVDAVRPGDYVQVQGNAADNSSQGNPGVFLNHNLVAFSGFGQRILTGVDPSSVGFQTGTVAGASAAPIGAAVLPAATTVHAAPPAAPAPAYTPPAGSSPPPPPAVVAVAPNPAYAPPAGAAPPPPPAAAPARVMLPAANGTTYEQFIAAGWTDAQLVQHGKMAA
jgi:hypothetical protein